MGSSWFQCERGAGGSWEYCPRLCWEKPSRMPGMSHGWGEMVEAVQQHVKSVSFELRRELRDVTYLNAHGGILEPHTVQERVVGLHLMGPSAGEVIQGFVVALRCGLIKQQLDTTVGHHCGTPPCLCPGVAQTDSNSACH
uniref:thioredoxin reductase 1, mitochondrial-like n=1 Tax=Oncorhynchus gorbuscha TaxID=8017 RepID=UPI001EAE9A9C|nr:thioredoxin reductase 1, mitochondrial-like [Oncorhynchus gorbuscha]XP_046153215.1 thioredoxin reductase 1, mitochondrial-like [Oncorhynchus gorbuscha]XP_046153216.1 thioredoxin reductase 1, mitochondrial-like [Oncorhynchus gorbuscha]